MTQLRTAAALAATLFLLAPASADDGVLGLTDPRAGDGDYEPRPLFNIPPQDGLGIGDPMPGQGDYQPRPLIRAADPAPPGATRTTQR